MKTKLNLFLALALSLPLAGARAQQWTTNTLPSGLIAWWAAEGNLLDSAGAHHGSGDAPPTFAPGRFGQAFQFNGTDQSVLIPDGHADLDGWTEFTLEAWVNLDRTDDAPGPGRSVISKVGNHRGPYAGNFGYQFGFANGCTQLFCQFNTDSVLWPGYQTFVNLPVTLSTGVWYHVAATYDHNAVRLYFNGLPLVTNVIGSVTIANTSASLRLSKDDNDNVAFAGRIDDARIYTRSLTATEITSLYAGSPVAGLAGRWSAEDNFLDSAGTNAGVSGGGVTFTNGKLNRAFRFVNSPDSVIQLPNSPTFQPANNQFTIEAWVKPDFTSSNFIDTILERRDSGCGSEPYSFLFSILKSYPGYPPGVFGLGMLPQISYHYSTNRIPDDGQFHHVAVTYNGNKPAANCTLYLDGRIVGGGNGSGPIPPSAIGPYIGVHRCLNANSSMTLDELAFYNRELAPGEIAALYRAAGGKTTTFIPPGLVSWWRGENDAGDATGAHPGTPQGSLAYAPGQLGQSFSLNGQNAAVALGNWFNLQQFTLSFWVNPAASQVQWADILDNNHTDLRSWVFQSGNSSPGATSHWSWGAAGVAGDYFSLSNGVWQHVVATVNSDHVTELYVNGESRFKLAGAGPVAYDGTQFMNLGKHQMLGRYFNGAVDELMVFDRALDAGEVTTLYINQGGPAALEIQRQGSDVLLSWPAGATPDLQTASALSPGDWQTVTNGVQPAGRRNTLLVPATSAAQFFRLKSGN